jgi:hypothetical protein
MDMEKLNRIADEMKSAISKLRGEWTQYVQKAIEVLVNTRPYWQNAVKAISDVTYCKSIIFMIQFVFHS